MLLRNLQRRITKANALYATACLVSNFVRRPAVGLVLGSLGGDPTAPPLGKNAPAYRRATCVVLPSVYRTRYGDESNVPELLGQTLLEGMACGTPAICTNVASMPEVVEDGVTGFVVPPNNSTALRDAIRRLMHDAQQLVAMGRAARQRVVDHFTWKAVVDRCLAIYGANASRHRLTMARALASFLYPA